MLPHHPKHTSDPHSTSNMLLRKVWGLPIRSLHRLCRISLSTTPWYLVTGKARHLRRRERPWLPLLEQRHLTMACITHLALPKSIRFLAQGMIFSRLNCASSFSVTIQGEFCSSLRRRLIACIKGCPQIVRALATALDICSDAKNGWLKER